ncbi:alcohol acetyltransferase [Xylogone sp. PMI_703]|nr:alcohol acetyltransferase [Xylogone sp. PMI_703]
MGSYSGIPAGILGRHYAARQTAGHYRSCAVTAQYHFTLSLQSFISLLKYALNKNLQRHPVLSYGLLNRTEESDAQFWRQEKIRWEDVVELRHVEDNDGDAILSNEIGKAHEYLFVDQTRKPAWKLFVVVHGTESLAVDLIYVSQHAISDGLSCVAFHKSLYGYLMQGILLSESDLAVEWPYVVLSSTPAPLLVENFLNITPAIEKSETATIATTKSDKTNGPEIWTGPKPHLPSHAAYASKLQILTIPGANVRQILAKARHLNTTITALLHALLVIYLSRTHPASPTFVAVTPYTLRPFTKISKDEMVNHISYIVSTWDRNVISAIRNAKPDAVDDFEASLPIAKQFRDEIETELKLIEAECGGPAPLREAAAVTDHVAACNAAMNRKRSTTYEISNVGVADFGPSFPGDGKQVLRLEKLVFSQCGMVVGPAIGLSVVSLRDGPLVVSIGWQEGSLEEGFVTNMTSFLKERLLSLGA